MAERKMDSGHSKFLVKLNEMDFGPLAYRLTNSEEEPAMSLDHAIDAIMKYKGFLFLCHANPGKALSPSKYVDFVWHAHMLDTELYFVQTTMLFGHPLHHFPFFGTRGAADKEELEEAARYTASQALSWFGWDDDDWCGNGHRPGPKGARSPWLDVYGNLAGNIKIPSKITVCMPADLGALKNIVTIKTEMLDQDCRQLLQHRPKVEGVSGTRINVAIAA